MKSSTILLIVAAAAIPSVLLSRQEPDPAAAPVTTDRFVADENTQIIIMPPTKEVHWDTLDLNDDRPVMMLEVPRGKRFVLTDVWTMRHQEYPEQTPDPMDRFWIEDQGEGKRRIVVDVKMQEAPHENTTESFRPLPMHWESGIDFGPGHQVWMSYDFNGDKKRNWLRRIHFSGYFVDA